MTAVSKNAASFYVLDDIVDKYNNTFHRTIKMKRIDVKSYSYAKYNICSNEKKILDLNLVLMLEFRRINTIFAKGYAPNLSKEVFIISKIKETIQWTYFIIDLSGEEIVGTFYEKELQKTN